MLDRIPGNLKITRVGRPRQNRNDRAVDFPRHSLTHLELFFGSSREARLQNIHPQSRQLLGDADLLVTGENRSRRLGAVPQGCIQNSNLPHNVPSVLPA